MNAFQEQWWRQAQSDHALFRFLQDNGFASCHLLHYLQMATEKLGKAYLWRSGIAPPRTHTGFVRFLRYLADQSDQRERLAQILEFSRADDFRRWLHLVLPLAYALQSLAPSEANDGPNPEYPWPHHAPRQHPANHAFPLWNELSGTSRGRKMLSFISRAITHFDQYA